MIDKLIAKAKQAKNNSYSPYSNFKVGCSILVKDDTYICGTNVENASYGATICAERSALCTLISQGYTKDDIVSIAIASDAHEPIAPCGICRQVILELAPAKCPIYMCGQENVVITTIEELVPFEFSKEMLNKWQKA